MKPISSAITTSLKAPLSKIGTQDGEHGSGTLVNSQQIAGWLSERSPKQVDSAAVSRAKSHGVGLRVTVSDRFPTGKNGERLPSYTVASGCLVSGTDEQRENALADLRNFQTPPPIRAVEDWLAELSVLTAGRGREGVSAALMINAYSSRLARYPADVVRSALLVKTWKWFPDWAELESECERLAAPRRQMIAALMQPAPEPEPNRRPPTAEERERINQLVAKQFPRASQGWRDAAVNEALKGDCIADDKRMKGDTA